MSSGDNIARHDIKCVKCNIYEKKLGGYKRYVKSQNMADNINDMFNVRATVGDFICAKCHMIYSLTSRINKAQTDHPIDTEQLKQSDNLAYQEQSEDPGASAEPEQSEYPGSSTEPGQSTDSEQRVQSLRTAKVTPQLLSQKIGFSFSSSGSFQSSDSTDLVVFPEKAVVPEELVDLPIPRCISTHKYCCLCKRTNDIITIPFNARLQVFTMKHIFIPHGNRCCKQHLIKNRFYEEDVNRFTITSNYSSIKVSEVSKLLKNLSINVDKELTDKIGDFSLTEERLVILTGLSWENLFTLRDMLPSLRNSESRNVIQAIVVFMFKLRSGNSNSIIAAVLGLERPQQVSDFSKSVLNSFERDVLPKFFGIKAVCREDLIQNHTAPVAKILHEMKDDQLALVCDGTYLRHEKSTNNDYQRKSYSVQKKTLLCKPFTICTTDGYIVDMMGPYYANLNDASILEQILNEPNGLSSILKKGDKFFLDRGFRDVIGKLTKQGYHGLMPALKGKRKQLTSVEANDSRMVTMVRWVVEAVHGVIGQKFKLLHNQFDNKMLPNAGTYCKIACFLHNMFGKRFISSISSSDEVLALIRSRRNMENSLAENSKSGRWSRQKKPFKKLNSAELLDFPEMTEEDLKIFFTGTYQLQQAISYLAELINLDDSIDISYLKESNNIVKIQVRSRHIAKKLYNCFIDYSPNSTGCGSIRQCYCECANGMRTIGCCSHVAAVIYYLSHARYLSKIVKPAEKLTKIFSREGIVPVINDDSDED